MSVMPEVVRSFVSPLDAAPSTGVAIDLLDALDALDPALAPVDANAWQAAVEQHADALQRALPRDAKTSRADLEAKASASLSEDHWARRGPAFTEGVATIDAKLADGEHHLTSAAEARRSVPLPAVGLTAAEQAALDKEGPTGLLGPLSGFTAAQLTETRRLNATNGELIAVLTLTDSTPTADLLDEMAHGSTPYKQVRAERLLRARQGQLRVDAMTADTQDARDAARAALQRFEAIREARVPESVRQAERREREAWQALAQHAARVKTRLAVWQQGVAHDDGLPSDVLGQWKQERQAIRSALVTAWKGVTR